MNWRGLTIETTDEEVYPPVPTTLATAEVACRIVEGGQRVLELGTGSGLIAIAIAHSLAEAQVVASDVNPRALETAATNAKRNGVDVELVQSDMFAEFEAAEFDVVVSHPPAVPYLPDQTWKMSDGMSTATNGGSDGSDLVCRTIAEAKSILRIDGRLVLGLPHWSNTRKAFAALDQHYPGYEIVRKGEVNFFPLQRGNPDQKLIEHVRRLTELGIIEVDFDRDPPAAPFSIVVTKRKSEI